MCPLPLDKVAIFSIGITAIFHCLLCTRHEFVPMNPEVLEGLHQKAGQLNDGCVER